MAMPAYRPVSRPLPRGAAPGPGRPLAYNPRAMPNRSRRATDRAEARRRARYAAMGWADDADDAAEDQADGESSTAPATQQGGSFLTRLFPPAPPLPGKPDPLAGFTYEGPLRGVVSGLFLLSRHPVPWLGLGVVWALARYSLPFLGGLGIIASLLTFGSLIAAGWVGWPRPWIFGLAASLVGILLYAVIAAATLPGLVDATASEIFVSGIYWEVVGFQPLFGALAGWYGGYLRRRMAATSASARQQGSRRR